MPGVLPTPRGRAVGERFVTRRAGSRRRPHPRDLPALEKQPGDCGFSSGRKPLARLCLRGLGCPQPDWVVCLGFRGSGGPVSPGLGMVA